MKKYFLHFFSICVFASLASCKQNSDTPSAQNLDNLSSNIRAKFALNKTIDQVKDDYRSLPIEQQKALWLDKIKQIKTQTLSVKQIELINQLQKILTTCGDEFKSSNSDFAKIGISLASITPKEDFLHMFATLDNYNYVKNQNIEICSECIIDLENSNTVTNNTNFRSSNVSCNCKWTCGWAGRTSSNCDRTDTGCGFMWLTSCTGYSYF